MSLCACSLWGRTDGRMTNHHPHCKEFKEQRFARISMEGGGTYTQPLHMLSALEDEIREADKGQKWTVQAVDLTQEEFDALPEFAGH